MATESVVQIILRARDEATSKIRSVSDELGGIGSIVSRLTTGLGPIGAAIAAAVAVGGAAIAATKNFSDMVTSLERVSHGADTTRAELQILRATFEEAGLGSEAADVAVQNMGIAIGRQDPLLKRLNITSRDSFQAILQLSDAFSRSRDQASKDAIAKQLLGRSAKDLVGIMDDLRQATDRQGKQMRAAGAIISDDMAAKARALHGQLAELGTQWQGVWTQMQAVLIPVAKVILETLGTLFDWIGKIGRGLHHEFVEPLEDLAKVAKEVETQADRIARAKEEARKIGGHVQVGVPVMDGIEVSATRKKDDSLQRALKADQLTMREWILDAMVVSDLKNKITLGPERRGDLNSAADWEKVLTILLSDDMKKVPETKTALDPLRAILEELDTASKGALEFANAVSNGLNAVWSGLDAGFSQVFANIFDRTQTLGSAMKSIFKSVVQSVMGYLGQLVASAVFNLFLRLAGAALGIPIGALPFVPGIGAPGASKHGLQPAGPASALGASGGNTYIVYAIDSRSALMDLTMPGGALRGAFDSLELRTAY